jgi:nucleoside-diphosphate-sugar epimerase
VSRKRSKLVLQRVLHLPTGRNVSVAIISGSAGLIGSEAALFFGSLGLDVVGIDNDMRGVLFGEEASTNWNRRRVANLLGATYHHHDLDIRDRNGILAVFAHYGHQIELVIHAAAQPSHDWAAREPFTDFDINAVGTLNLLEATRLHAPDATFIFTSTNKVYESMPDGCYSVSFPRPACFLVAAFTTLRQIHLALLAHTDSFFPRFAYSGSRERGAITGTPCERGQR